MRVLQVLKIPYAALPDLLLHLKILHKLSLVLKIHHLHNLLSIILQSPLNIILLHMFILQYLLTLPLLKIHQLNKLISIVLLHLFIPPKSPHTTPPLQNPPFEQALQHRSPPHAHSQKSPPHTTSPLQNPAIEQALQHQSPTHFHSPKSPPHTTPPLQNPPTEQAL
jgi:hypothetical protein